MAAPRSRMAKDGIDPETGFKDFSEESHDPIGFKVDGDIFYAIGDAPAGTFLDLAEVAASEGTADTVSAVKSFFEKILTDDCVDLFLDRMDDTRNPITLTQALNAFKWLVEVYSGQADRPFQVASFSQTGSAVTGPNSAARVRSRGTIPDEED